MLRSLLLLLALALGACASAPPPYLCAAVMTQVGPGLFCQPYEDAPVPAPKAPAPAKRVLPDA